MAADAWRRRCLSLQSEFGWFLASVEGVRPAPFIDRAFMRALAESWIRPEALVMPVARYLTAKYPRALGGGASSSEPQLFEVIQDPLFIAMLRQTPAATPGLDRLLARLRHGALRAVVAHQDIGGLIPILTALAVRGWHSGYALTMPLDPVNETDLVEEPALVADLGRQLEQGERPAAEIIGALAVYATFAAPGLQHMARALAASDPAADYLQQEVVAPQERQRAIAEGLEPATTLDETSAAVAAQYEVHPYPAWIGEPNETVALPLPVIEVLGEAGADGVRSVLVAGCGTGQHALVAADAWPRADILAIDISRTSLAYAIDRTRDSGHGRIEFALADLLQAEQLGRRFQIIESMGVLHHLADPAAGLRALAGVLEPGGLIGIALYSRVARADLADIRRRYGKTDVLSDDAVRHFRAWALATLGNHPLLYSPDFYSIGGCRDAFFHVREHCYGLEEIGALLTDAGLRLVAVQTPPGAHEVLGEVPGPTDLAGWAAAEQAHPSLFISMYEIWAQAR